MQKTEKIEKSRLRSAYLTTLISTSMVLFVIGIICFVLLNANQLAVKAKENIKFSVVIHKGAKNILIQKTIKQLERKEYVKSLVFESPKQIAKRLEQDLGEDFIKTLGYNPLYPTIKLGVKYQYVTPEKMKKISEELTQIESVYEVVYHKSLLNQVYSNIKKISLYLLIITGLLFFLSFSLINNTIRLEIFSNRFLIRTMQLVGATHRFIRSPFLIRGFMNGVVSAVLSSGALIILLYYFFKKYPILFRNLTLELYGYLFLIILVVGILVSWISTNLAVRKYLRLKTSELY